MSQKKFAKPLTDCKSQTIADSFALTLCDSLVIVDSVIADSATATIRLSRAQFVNENNRFYTADSMRQAASNPATQEEIALGLMVGHIEHPDAVADEQGNAVGFNARQKPRAFWFRKLWFDDATNELLASIEMMPTAAGKYLTDLLKAGEKIKFSLRALGDCETQADGVQKCSIDEISGGDNVSIPALKDAEPLAVSIKDSKTPAIKKSFNKTSAIGDKRNRVSGGKFRIGDATMTNEEVMKTLEGLPDKEAMMLFLQGFMAGGGGGSMPDPMIEEKKPDALPDPMIENKQPAYDAATIDRMIGDALTKALPAAVKAALPEDKMAAIDSVHADKQAAANKKTVTDAVAAIEVAGEVEGRKLADYSEAQLKPILDRAKEKKSADDAVKAIADALQVIDENNMTQFGNTFKTNGGAKGVTIITDEADKNLEGKLALLDTAVARRDKSRHTYAELKRIDEYKKINKPFVDLLMKDHMTRHGREISDFLKRSIKDDANLITSSDLRNENGVLAAALKREVFQRLSALQYVDAFGPGPTGQVFKIPVKMYTPPTAGSYRRHYEVRAGESIAEAESALRYNLFSTILRALAFRLGKELEVQIKTGVVGLDAVGETLSDISDDMARQTDSMILGEMQHTCDQYLSTLVSNEAVAAAEWTGAADAVPITVVVGGDIGSVTYGSSATKGPAYAAKLLTGFATTYTGHPRPIVEPQRKVVIDGETNLTTVTDDGRYPVTIDTLGGVTQVRGELDGDGNIQALIPGTTPTYAIDNERGIILFLKTGVSGAAAATRPTLDYYYATNYDEFNLTPLANNPPENHYSGLLRLIMQMSGIMSSGPRFQPPDWILFHESIARGAFGIADLFENQRSPTDVNLNAGFAASDVVGALPGITVTQSNGVFFAGARRAILGRRGMSSYMVSSPAEVISQPGGNVVGSKVLPTPESVWFMQLLDVVGTAVLINPADGAIKKHPGRTIRFTGSLANTVIA